MRMLARVRVDAVAQLIDLLGWYWLIRERGVVMRKAILTILVGVVVVFCGPAAQAADPHPTAQPFGGLSDVGEPSYHVEGVRAPMGDRALIPTDHLVMGTEHILDQQCHNGGFGWPHDDCSATYHNINGPILLGALGTYYFTRDAIHLLGVVNGGAFDLTYQFVNGEANFSSFTPIFMLYLARASENTTFSIFVSTELFDELAAGTYGPDDLDTAGWIARIETLRTGTWVNLRSWEFHTLIPAAQVLGQPGQDGLFEQGVLDGLATLDNSDPVSVFSDVIGLTGAVRGLAFARRFAFPAISAPLHPGVNGIDNLEDLAAYLASLQNLDGSWNWHSNLAMPTTDDEDVQTAAYALLALLEVDVMTAVSYQAATESARDWIVSLQLPDGGFPSWPGGSENTEIEGEAVTAVAAFDARIFVDGFESGDTGLWSTVVP